MTQKELRNLMKQITPLMQKPLGHLAFVPVPADKEYIVCGAIICTHDDDGYQFTKASVFFHDPNDFEGNPFYAEVLADQLQTYFYDVEVANMHPIPYDEEKGYAPHLMAALKGKAKRDGVAIAANYRDMWYILSLEDLVFVDHYGYFQPVEFVGEPAATDPTEPVDGKVYIRLAANPPKGGVVANLCIGRELLSTVEVVPPEEANAVIQVQSKAVFRGWCKQSLLFLNHPYQCALWFDGDGESVMYFGDWNLLK